MITVNMYIRYLSNIKERPINEAFLHVINTCYELFR